jgi:hypothetical protein
MKNMELKTADGVETGVQNPSAFEGLKDKTKEFALEQFASLKEKAGAFAKENWAKISGKTTEWIGDIGEGLKLRTIDKWKMARAEKSENKLIKHKERDIANEEKKMGKLDGKIGKEEASKKKAEEDFAKLASGAEGNEALMAIIQRGKVEQVGKNDSKLGVLNTEKEGRGKKQEEYKGQIETYKKNIENLERNFADKVDGRIDKIKERDNYENNKVRLETAIGSIGRLEDRISNTSKNLAQYEEVWKQRKILGKEGKKELREKMDQLKDFLNNSEKHLEISKKLKAKYEKKIAKTDKRVSSLQEFKGKYVGKKDGGDVKPNEDFDVENKTDTSSVEDSNPIASEMARSGEGESVTEEEVGDEGENKEKNEALEAVKKSIDEAERLIIKDGEYLSVFKLAVYIGNIKNVIDKNIEKIGKNSPDKVNRLAKIFKELESNFKSTEMAPLVSGKNLISTFRKFMKDFDETK